MHRDRTPTGSSQHPSLRRACCFAVLIGSWAWPSLASAEKPPGRVPGALFGGRIGPPPPKPEVKWDPWLPTGPERVGPERPVLQARSCSFRRPVCVHYAAASDASAGVALAALEDAWDKAVLVNQFPPPLGDAGRGGDSRLDWYLLNTDSPSTAQRLEVLADEPVWSSTERAPGFCVGRGLYPAELERRAVQCVTEASALSLDAAEGAFARRAVSTQFWWVAGYPTDSDVEAIDDAQRNPQLAVGGQLLSASSEGAALLYEYLDEQHGAGRWGALGMSLYALGGGRTEGDGWLYDNEPDTFDVLRHSFDDDPVKVADMLADFALARAFLGDRSDGRYFAPLGWVGSFGRVRFDWSFRYSELPRHVAPWRPVEPTGAAYILVDLDKLPTEPELGLRASWEIPVSFKWSVTILDTEGKLRKQVAIKYEARAAQTERTIVLDAKPGEALLVIGVNQGGVNLSHPFDPDVEPYEPHEYALYLVNMD